MENPAFDINDVISNLGGTVEAAEEPASAPNETTTDTPAETTTESPAEQTEVSREQALLDRIETLTEERIRSTTAFDEDTPVETPAIEHNYMDGLDIDDVLSHSDNLNKLLLAVHNKILSDASRITAENIMRSLPRVISQYVNNHITMAEMVKEFYVANPDLQPVKRTVAAIANEIIGNEPGLNTEELFRRAGEKTREVLKLKQVTPNPQKATPRGNPAFARQKGRALIPELTGIEKEIDDLIMR